MAAVLNRTTKEYRPSANTPDFPVAEWIINPDLTAVAGQPIKYWIITGDVVTLASPAQQAVIDAVDMATHHMGLINAAVNCAGVIGAGRVLGREATMALDFFSKTVQINLVGSFNVIKAAGAAMESNTPGVDGERGVIISTASVAAYDGQIGQAAYSASKGGIVGMTLPIAREFARIGVRVNTVAPGIFWTPMVDGMPDHVQESLSASIPFPSRLGQPEEYAELVAHIMENGYINGETIRLDGAVRLAPK